MILSTSPERLEPADAPDVARLRGLIDALEAGLLERAAAVRLVLLAALAGEHVLLIGPPGTAKSELARRLHRSFDGARYFERLLTRFSTPEELFGPLSLKALEDDRYERLTDGYLPTASIGFLDEVFKANSAILNALLTLLNEREFDNGAGRARTPLISVVGATNEVPLEEALMAFYDRFLVRVPVAPVSDAAFARLLALRPPESLAARPVTRAELSAWLARRNGVALPDDVLAHLQALREYLRETQINVSDRRWRQAVGLLRTAAFTEGRARIDALDLWLMPYALAAQPSQVAVLQAWYVQHVAQAAPQEAAWLTRAVEAFEKQLQIEQSAQAQDGSDGAGKLALARAIGAAQDDAMPRLTSAALDGQSSRRWSSVHVASRVAQVDQILARSRAQRAALHVHAQALRRALDGRLWLPPDLAAQLQRGLDATLDRLDGLMARLDAARSGFAELPLDAQQASDVPEPIAISA
jgi:MoxR-like ATPase